MRRVTNRILASLLALVMVLVMIPTAFAEPTNDDIVILHTNDVHTYIDGPLNYAVLAGIKAELEKEYKTVLLVDAGDHAQGTAYGSMDKGETIIKLMNAAGYDAATLGNHEFDYGQEGRIAITDTWAQYPYLSCNFYHEADGVRGENVLDSYKIFEAGDEKIAVVGITTPESFTKSTPAYFQDENGNYIYGISGGTDGAALYADVQAAIDAAKADGATKVIALGHLGVDPSSQPWTSREVIANTTGLTAFIDGHSHTTVPGETVADKAGKDVVLAQTGEYFGTIGMMVIDDETGAISTDLIGVNEVVVGEGDEAVVVDYTLVADNAALNDKSVKEFTDAGVAKIQSDWIAKINEELGQVIGSTELTLGNYDEQGNRLVRKQGTNAGSFAADALYYLFDNMGEDVDVAIMNGGGIRNENITGNISYLTCKAVHTFGNMASLQTITGQQLLDALEWGAQATPAENGGFLHTSGVKYTVDCNVESTVQKDAQGVWTGSPTGEYRVKDVQVYNKETGKYEPLDLEASYNLAGYNYTIQDMGDGFAMFDGGTNLMEDIMEDYMVLANYVKSFEGGVVGATNSPLAAKYPGFGVDYSNVKDNSRITVIEAEVEEDAPITIGGLDNDIWMTKYGNVYCDCEATRFVNELGLTWADLVTVKFLDQELVLPVVPDYSYVDSGKPAIILGKTAQGYPTGYVSLAINMGNFAETYGIAIKHTNEDGWYWTAAEGVKFPIELTFTLAEKEGYMAEYLLHELVRTNERSDYPDLTDEEFANFRVVATTGMGKNVLYRSSSPINPELSRNTYADAAMKKAGVTVVMNLADSAEDAKAYEGFADTYYADQKVIYLNLGVDFAADDFKAGLAKGLKFFAENEGTYLIHCNEGKDRAGFVSALLECLMGATYEQVAADYMVTYENYYGVEKGTEKYDAILNSNIVKSLEAAFGVADLSKADLAKEAEAYIKSLGLSDSEIAALKVNLGGAEDAPDTGDAGVTVYAVLALVSLAGAAAVVTAKKKELF